MTDIYNENYNMLIRSVISSDWNQLRGVNYIYYLPNKGKLCNVSALDTLKNTYKIFNNAKLSMYCPYT